MLDMRCPSCAAPMTAQTLDGHQGRTVDIDICGACQAFWFDHYESLQLTPGATLRLFGAIGEQAAARQHALSVVAKCPRCQAHLSPTHDRQRNVGFQYFRCPNRHGRLITFVDFLREKNFIRPLSAEQVAELRKNLHSVNCSNCGGPIDLAKGTACGHCGSPISMLDMRQAEMLIAQLQQADSGSRALDPALPMRLEQARREVEAAFAGFERQPQWFTDVSSTDLVTAGLGALARWLRSRG
jgi:Zn-finger nucleic acid-binding protein